MLLGEAGWWSGLGTGTFRDGLIYLLNVNIVAVSLSGVTPTESHPVVPI